MPFVYICVSMQQVKHVRVYLYARKQECRAHKLVYETCADGCTVCIFQCHIGEHIPMLRRNTEGLRVVAKKFC